MKVAILSDIHGNLEALEAVLADLKNQGPDQVICLGDLVGYGPDPEAVVQISIDQGFTAILGNHEAALISKKDRDWMNFQTKENSIATKALLSQPSLKHCIALPRSIIVEKARFVHGCPPDSVLKYLYLLTDNDISEIADELGERLCFVGHTHELVLVSVSRGQIVREQLKEGCHLLQEDRKYLINAGSVGQPRDMNRKAKYVLWDSSSGILEVRALSYPSHITADKILARGFPKAYAIRISS